MESRNRETKPIFSKSAIDRIVFEHTGIEIKRPAVFTVKTADEWMRDAAAQPTPKKLFGSLWMEGELSILYADTGVGKTILGVQIADNISSGKQTLPFENETPAQQVLYLDFELTEKQFQMRYTHNNNMHVFNSNFLRAELSIDDDVTEDMVMQAIEEEVLTKQIKVVVVDNITYLKSETEKGSNALPLMKQLNQLKKLYGLSILVLAHTPKRDECLPIVINDLSGSKMISNFIDGAFAIGRSYEAHNKRYIKQIKCRSNEVEYHGGNVVVVELVKEEDCMTRFTTVGFTDERMHLKQQNQTEHIDLSGQVYELADKGYTQRQIADEIGRSLGYVNKQMQKRKQEG